MIPKEWNDLRRLALKLTNDEDITQELLFEIIKLNLSFPLAVNYVKLCLRGSAYRLNAKHNGKRKKDAMNHSRISLETTPADADDCTIIEIIKDTTTINPQTEIELSEFFETLTDTEREILNLVLEGFTVREICKLKKISSKTYSKILSSIRRKALEFFT